MHKLLNFRSLADMPVQGKYNASENDDMCDWIALVDWQYTVAKNDAVRELPFTRRTACKIYDHRQEQVEQIKAELARRSHSANAPA